MANWSKYREDDGGWVHTLPIDETDARMKIEKSRGGDYTITCLREGDPCGGDVEYRETLDAAKKEAERIVADGEWQDYLLDAA